MQCHTYTGLIIFKNQKKISDENKILLFHINVRLLYYTLDFGGRPTWGIVNKIVDLHNLYLISHQKYLLVLTGLSFMRLELYL